MDQALAVQERHLALPDSCCFSPSELVISADTTKEEFARICHAVSAVDNASNLWISDAAVFALDKWKKDGLKILADATGYSVGTLYSSQFVARAFPPSKRIGQYRYNHYRYVRKFPEKWRDEFLQRHKDDSLSCRNLLAVAEKEFNAAPKETKAEKATIVRSATKRSVTIRADLYARISMYCESQKTSTFIEQILTAWLSKQPDASAAAPKPETKRERHIQEVNERKVERQKRKEDRVALKQKTRDDKAAARAKALEEKATAKAKMHEEKRATYAERRQAQLDAGAALIAEKRKKKPGRLNRQWVDCKPAMVDDKSTKFPTKFWSEADAQAADQQFFKAKGFHQLVVKCPVCSASSQKRDCWHVRWDAEGVRLAQEMVQSVTDRSAVQQVSPKL